MTIPFTFFGESVFSGVSIWALVFLAIVYTGSFTVKGVFGMGAMPAIVLLSALVLDAHHAVLLAMLVVTYSQVQFVPESFKYGDWKLCGLLAIGYAPTVIVGVWIFDRLTNAWLGVVVGFLLVGAVLAELVIPQNRIREVALKSPRFGAIFMAAICGVLNGIVGAGSLILLSIYLKNLFDDSRTFRATILLISILVSVWRFLVQYSKGIITPSLVGESLVFFPAAYLGVFLGIRLFKSIPSNEFFRLFRIFLVITAMIIVIRNLMQIY